MGVVAIVGPTASGKSAVAMHLATELSGEIVTVDSMQVYRGMDIGSAKPTPDERRAVPHHLIDVAEPEESFTVSEHQRLGIAAIDEIEGRGTVPIVAGGSGLHFRALVDPLVFPPSDPEIRSQIEAMQPADAVVTLLAADPGAGEVVDLDNPRRVARALEILELTGDTPTGRAETPDATAVRNYEPRLPLCAIGLDPGDLLPERVERRFDAMLELGLLEEVARLEPSLGVTARQGVGYKELLPVVRGESTLAEAREAAIRATMGLAKRQRTFFRRDPRIEWIPWHDEAELMAAQALDVARRRTKETAWTS